MMKRFLDNTLLQLLAAVVVGLLLGFLGIAWLNEVFGFVATIFTRLFQLLATPTIALAIITTLASFGASADVGRIFRRTLTYTLLTTFVAAAVGLTLFLLISQPLTSQSLTELAADSSTEAGESYLQHIIEVIPNNLVRPFLEGNVLSVLLLATAVGLALAYSERRQQQGEGKGFQVITKFVFEVQELLFMLIRALVKVLPIGIIAFSAQLAIQISDGVVAGALGRYLLIILTGNAIQFFVVLPLFLLARGLNPLHVFRGMMPAVLMALFTKSSAATLPVTMQCAEQRLGVRSEVARFVLPICTTINMNGCAAFILVTSLFVMQCGGLLPDASTSLPAVIGFYALWLFIAVFAAVGNAGVPMGCYFLTLSLVSGIEGAPVAVLGLILPLYTVIDMIETAENVWSDSCVCALTAKGRSA